MKCSSCIGGARRSLPSSDHESTTPVTEPAADRKQAQTMETNFLQREQRTHGVGAVFERNQQTTSATSKDSDDYRPPSITIEELDDDVFEGNVENKPQTMKQTTHEKEADYTSVLSYTNLLKPLLRAPLDVIREEESSDCSDTEFSHFSLTTHESESKPRECKRKSSSNDVPDSASSIVDDSVAHDSVKFSPGKVLRDILRYRRSRRHQNRQPSTQTPQLHRRREHQEQTTCVLVGAREGDIVPQYRSICTTDTVHCEMMEVEVINIGSNSSSMDDLSDVDAQQQDLQEEGDKKLVEQFEGKKATDSVVLKNQLKTINYHDQGTVAGTNTEMSPENQLEDTSRQLEHASVKWQSILADYIRRINPTLNQIQSDPSTVSQLYSELDITQNDSLSSDHEHVTQSNYAKMIPHYDGLRAARTTPVAGPFCSPENSKFSFAPAQPVPSPRSRMPNETDGHDDDAVPGNSSGTDGDHYERDRFVRSDIDTATRDENMLSRISVERGQSASFPSANSEALLGSFCSGVANIDCDRTSVVSNARIIKVLTNSAPYVIDCASATFGVSSIVNHCLRDWDLSTPFMKTIMSIEDEASTGEAFVKNETRIFDLPSPLPPVPAPRVIPLPPPPLCEVDVTNSGQRSVKDAEGGEEQYTVSGAPLPSPPSAGDLVPLTVEALSSYNTALPSLKYGQIHIGGHFNQTDHADADPNSAQDSVNAVASTVREVVSGGDPEGDQSVLLKYIHKDSDPATFIQKETSKSTDQMSGSSAGNFVRQKQPGQTAPAKGTSGPGKRNNNHGPKIDSVGGGRRGGQYLCDERFEETVTRAAQISRNHPAQDATSMNGVEPIEQNRLKSTDRRASNGHQERQVDLPVKDSSSSERKAALVADLRTEISRLKDAELHEEFRKLELETARFEKELGQITVPTTETKVGNEALESRTYFVSKQRDFVVERSSSSACSSSTMTGVNARGNALATPVNKTVCPDDLLYNEWQETMEQREERRLQRTLSSEQTSPPQRPVLETDSPASAKTWKTIPTPPPPPPPNRSAIDYPVPGEENITKKVKDRVRDLMASQAAAADEGCGVIRQRGQQVVSSAPSTPSTSRKHIEAEFEEFRDIREREAAAAGKQLSAAASSVGDKNHTAKQFPVHGVHNYSPSRISHATSKIPTCTNKKSNVLQHTTSALKANTAETEQTEKGKDVHAPEAKVNVAALIASHQEKQQLQGQPSKVVLPIENLKTVLTVNANKSSSSAVQNPQDENSSEPVISVSDKCQQFEQRIRQNSIGSADAVEHRTNLHTTNKSHHSAHRQQARPGTSNRSYGNEFCDALGKGFSSEADLLHEIDHALVLAKDFLFSRGVWSPFNRSSEILTKEELVERSSTSRNKSTEPQQPVWIPRSAPPSPASERREFRPIGFESPTPTRRTLTLSPAAPSASVAAPWNQPGYNPPPAVASKQQQKPNPIHIEVTPKRACSTPTSAPPGQQFNQVRFAPQPRTTVPQEPTINSLLKSKDGKTASSVRCADSTECLQKDFVNSTNTNQTLSCSTSTTTTYKQQSSSSDLNRTVGSSPMTELSESQQDTIVETDRSSSTQHQKMQQMPHHKVEGIGPITREGMPLTLRSEIDEENRDKWYKQMYQTLHKAHGDDDYVTVRYKTRRGYPYKASGYQSEPEPNYDSDYTIKYSTLDCRRTPVGLNPTSYNKFNTLQTNPTLPQNFHQASVKSGRTSYKNQPGRIENYTPGRSSISEKESKEWWDEVMEIFNGQLEHQKLTTSKTYTEGNLSRALKEQGYESDSTLVFRKREPPSSDALSPVEQKHFYKTMQAGGEIPIHGFRKPAPEKPKADRSQRAIETEVKVEINEKSSTTDGRQSLVSSTVRCTNPFLSRDEVTCYPITNLSRPLDMFGPFPKETRTFVPPVPPNRKSSRCNSTLKIMSQVKTNSYDKRTILERSTTSTTTTSGNQHAKFRSKPAGPPFFLGTNSGTFSIVTPSSASTIKEEKNQENNTRATSKGCVSASSYPPSSSSPTSQQSHQRKASPSPVAFGRGISKERTFAEEKKRIEEKLPKVVSVSTSILRNPELKSPSEVKKALRSSYLPVVDSAERLEKSSLKHFSSNGTFRSASSLYSSNKSLNSRAMSPAIGLKREEQKTYKVTVALTSDKRSKLDAAHHHHLPKRHLSSRKANAGRTGGPSVTIKTSIHKTSKAFGLRNKTPSSQSLARTSSTYSIDSSTSKRRSRLSYVSSSSNNVPSSRGFPVKTLGQRVFPAGRLDRSPKCVQKVPASMQKERCIEHNGQQQLGTIRTDSFFQNLFLKEMVPVPSVSVPEKARMWNSLSCRSEPSLKQPNYYLSQAKPVSSSKFRSLDQHDARRRLLERSFERRPHGEVIEQVNRFESLIKLKGDESDADDGKEQHQFGYVRGRRMKIDYRFHERSRSEPPTATATTMTSTVIQEELVSTNSPRTIVGRRCQVAPRTSRSPSCRRIQYLRGKEGQVKKIVRARSLSGHNEQGKQRLEVTLVRSHSLNLNHETAWGVSRSRFRDLNTFYNSLERLGQLERVTLSSSSDLRPARRTHDEEIIDFDLWKRVRDHEKAERELTQLKQRLKLEQREKDLFFLPRDPEEARWRCDLDTGLRNREKSVEDLKCILSRQALSFEEAKLRELETRKDHYKPLWRGSSVNDVASHLEEKCSGSGEKRDEPQSLDIISSNLLSTLSTEQMRKLKKQLSEIYSNGTGVREQTKRVTEEKHQEAYIIHVPERANRLESLLKVRSHSVLTQDQVNSSQQRQAPLKKVEGKNTTATSSTKATVVASIQKTYEGKRLPKKEVDRATLSRTLCQELKDKILEKHHTLPSIGKQKKNARQTILPTEGQNEYLSLESGMRKLERVSLKEENGQPSLARNVKKKEEIPHEERPHSYCDTESISSETSSKTVIFRSSSQLQDQAGEGPPVEDIKSKIKYFEEKHTADETPTVTIYHAREDSSPSEDEMATHEKETLRQGTRGSTLTVSQSFTDLKDLFGEKRSVSCSVYTTSSSCQEPCNHATDISPQHFTFRSRSSTPDYATCIQTGEVKKIKDKFESLDGNMGRQSANSDRQYQSDSELSRHARFDQNEVKTSRKSTPKRMDSIVRLHEAGDVSRMMHKYELQAAGRARCRKSRKERVISPIPKHPLRRDDRFMPHINVISKTASLKQEIKSAKASTHHHRQQHTAKTTGHLQSTQLADESARIIARQPTSARRSASSDSEKVTQLKSKFQPDVAGASLSLLGKMYTSVPDIREMKDISGYLSGAWIAHQFPSPTDNARSLIAPEQSPPGRRTARKGSTASPDRHHQHHHRHPSQQQHRGWLRSHSFSPPRQKSQKDDDHHGSSRSRSAATILRQFYNIPKGDLFDDRTIFDRPKADRFVLDRQFEAEALWRKIQSMATGNTAAGPGTGPGKPYVTFEEPHITFPSPPMKGAQPPPPPPPPPLTSSLIANTSNGAESPRRYIESDVNIHYKTPIRFEYKEPIPDDELAYQQAEHMRRVYQEERRRKYIHEMEDMHSRRHMDNIPPSQKSPIPLNRYDDFPADLSPKPHVLQPKTIARALYNFQGQSIRELSFRKGDIIYLRRQVDKNWYEGEHNATVGLLPANYIEILTRDNVNEKPMPKKPAREGKARAKFNFTAQTAVELSLLKGELVSLTRRVDENWFEGKIGSKKGIFPVSYVEILTDINGEESYDIEHIVNRPQSAQALTTHYGTSHINGRVSPGIVRETKTIQKTEVLHVDTSNEPISYRALYNYKPQNSDELELLEGDMVYVLEKCDDGWYVGTSARTGCFGTFPGNYVSKM